ncbi:hypothetical+protein [Methylocapsa aurea]
MSEAEIRIRRAERRRSFTIIDNRLLAAGGLSLEAMGLLAYLLSRPDDWIVRLGYLCDQHRIGRDRMRRIMSELREAGYAQLETVRDEHTGRVKGSVWSIFEESSADGDGEGAEDAEAPNDRAPENPSLGVTERLKTRQSEKPTVGKPVPIINTEVITNTDSEQIPLPPKGGVERGASRKGEKNSGEVGAAAEARWKAMKKPWPFDPAATPGDARAAFMALSVSDQESAIRYAPRYLAATEGRKRKFLGNWIAARGWDDFVEQEAAAAAKKSDVRAQLAALHEGQRAKYGGVLIRWGSPQNAAWARYDTARGVDWRREVRSYPTGEAYVRPSEWPPSSAARDGPQSATE